VIPSGFVVKNKFYVAEFYYFIRINTMQVGIVGNMTDICIF